MRPDDLSHGSVCFHLKKSVQFWQESLGCLLWALIMHLEVLQSECWAAFRICEALYAEEILCKFRVAVDQLVKRVQLHDVKWHKRTMEWWNASSLHNLLLRGHEVKSSEVYHISYFDTVDERIDQPASLSLVIQYKCLLWAKWNHLCLLAPSEAGLFN